VGSTPTPGTNRFKNLQTAIDYSEQPQRSKGRCGANFLLNFPRKHPSHAPTFSVIFRILNLMARLTRVFGLLDLMSELNTEALELIASN
jgi:hypothetical protein